MYLVDSANASPDTVYDNVPLGAVLSGIAYGIAFALFVISFLDLCRQLTLTKQRIHMAFIAVIITIFTLSTVFMVALILPVAPLFPSTPVEDKLATISTTMQNVSYPLGNWMMDGLLVWRCFQISRVYGNMLMRMIVVCTLGLLSAASLAFGVLFMIAWETWDLAFMCISLALNVITTGLIVSCMLLIRRRVVQALGNRHGSRYTYVAKIAVESASIYTLFLILALVLYRNGGVWYYIFWRILPPVQTISSLLIVMRVMRKRESPDTAPNAGRNAEAQSAPAQPVSLDTRDTPSEDNASIYSCLPMEIVIAHDVFVSKE